MSRSDFALCCPLPPGPPARILLAHGGGGRLTSQLIEEVFLPAFANPGLAPLHDGAVLEVGGARLAFTTDSFVVQPLFFPGGDIGTLAVNGTVNDLAMCGARPLYLSAGFILEEGLQVADLERVVASMRRAAAQAQVLLVTADTKVVERARGDGLYVNTAGIGLLHPRACVSPRRVRPGDAVLVSGDLGRHGVAVMAQREGLAFEGSVASDCAPLAAVVEEILEAGVDVHCLRDLTRGGLATCLVEIAEQGACRIEVEECAIPVDEPVRGACEVLGLDPLYVANEGRFLALVPPQDLDRALAVMRRSEVSRGTVVVGRVVAAGAGQVCAHSPIGARRVLDRLSGEQLPRIC
ncbi:MAG: hydrogenase expression/formation protein HypE [Candidatus Latescibacterota bacterium]